MKVILQVVILHCSLSEENYQRWNGKPELSSIPTSLLENRSSRGRDLPLSSSSVCLRRDGRKSKSSRIILVWRMRTSEHVWHTQQSCSKLKKFIGTQSKDFTCASSQTRIYPRRRWRLLEAQVTMLWLSVPLLVEAPIRWSFNWPSEKTDSCLLLTRILVNLPSGTFTPPLELFSSVFLRGHRAPWPTWWSARSQDEMTGADIFL